MLINGLKIYDWGTNSSVLNIFLKLQAVGSWETTPLLKTAYMNQN